MKKPLLRPKTLLLSTGVLLGALALGLGAAGVTYAALAANTTVPGATVSAGSLGLTVNGASTAAIGPYSVVPGTPQAYPFTVTNTGTTPMDVSASIAVGSSAAIKDNMQARVTPVANAGACVVGLTGTQGALAGYTATNFTSLAAGQSAVVCLEVGLLSTTPVAQAGQSATFTATLTGTQKAR